MILVQLLLYNVYIFLQRNEVKRADVIHDFTCFRTTHNFKYARVKTWLAWGTSLNLT